MFLCIPPDLTAWDCRSVEGKNKVKKVKAVSHIFDEKQLMKLT